MLIIEPLCVDPHAHGYATFQSHNQKVLANEHGIFLTHLRTRNQAYTAQMWRLLRSTDDGRSFQILYESTDATNPPIIESDRVGNLYLVRSDFIEGHAYLYRFLAERDFRDPIITPIPWGGAGKFAMVLDEARGQIYYASHIRGRFHVVGLDGEVRSSRELVPKGPDAMLMYPQLELTPDGTLHLAWTTNRPKVYHYWDIHHMLSEDGGATWRNMGGELLTEPILADQHGPALRVTLDDEFEGHTSLTSFIVKGGRVHFAYQAQGQGRQHHVGYDLATGRREIDHTPAWGGQTLAVEGFDGFFATADGRTADGPLYYVSRDQAGHLVCVVSHDNGATWRDHARSERAFKAYAIGGSRHTAADGAVLASFTDQQSNTATDETGSQVYFVRIPG